MESATPMQVLADPSHSELVPVEAMAVCMPQDQKNVVVGLLSS